MDYVQLKCLLETFKEKADNPVQQEMLQSAIDELGRLESTHHSSDSKSLKKILEKKWVRGVVDTCCRIVLDNVLHEVGGDLTNAVHDFFKHFGD